MLKSRILKDNDIRSKNKSKSESERTKLSRGLVEIDADLCKECGLCIEACPVGVLKISESLNKMGYHSAKYIGEGCTGCGICFYICPEPGTIKVYKQIKTSK